MGNEMMPDKTPPPPRRPGRKERHGRFGKPRFFRASRAASGLPRRLAKIPRHFITFFP